MQIFLTKLKSGSIMLSMGVAMFAGYATFSGDPKFYRECLMPLAHFIDPETIHNAGIKLAQWGIWPSKNKNEFSDLKTHIFGLEFPNPVGVAAGFDKQGQMVVPLLKSGFGFVEVGSVTPEPQPGNPKPRVFRLKEDKAIINRYGFNSDGHEAVYNRLKDRPWKGLGIVGINLGKNKDSPDPTNDFVLGVKKFGEIADYLVINVSSPNTPGLRDMQKQDVLEKMLTKVVKARNSLSKKTPLLLKISPDESDEDLQNIAKVIQKTNCRIDGLVLTNTTVSRPNHLQSKHVQETGGLSGKPLKDRSTDVIRRMSKLTNFQIPIIGVGGISSVDDVIEKTTAGATLVEMYTSITYEGPLIGHQICSDLQMRINAAKNCPVPQKVTAS